MARNMFLLHKGRKKKKKKESFLKLHKSYLCFYCKLVANLQFPKL